ncbi:MAG: hypothetical protein HGA45_23815 [Chloroflexales bacterium]|nr:hypothetical protein [Chloroflexales bacterium]
MKNTKGAVGYVELVFALANKLPVPQVKNAAGNYICSPYSPRRAHYSPRRAH